MSLLPRRYEEDVFHTCYKMHPHMFYQMMYNVAHHDPYFIQTRDNLGRINLSTEQELTCAMRMFTYCTTTDWFNETFDIAESTIIEILEHFTRAIRNVYR